MIDVVNIKIEAGHGGDGRVSFRREKFIPKGGPDGGDGGKGGSVYFIADKNMATLSDFRSKPFYKATNGGHGGPAKMSGLNGDDLYIKAPLGTLIYNIENGREILVCDLTEDKQTFLIAKGGYGGRGNFRFRSSVNQAPRQYTPGVRCPTKEIKLEVKLLADVGLVGYPNAGKSTLINFLTNTSAKVASYPFTTLEPNLGIARLSNGQEVVIADIPGIIQGASKGKGLGEDFLKHIERTRVLVHLVDPFNSPDDAIEKFDSSIDLVSNAFASYTTIRHELEEYGKDIILKPEIVVINKIDLTEVKDKLSEISDEFEKHGVEVFGISAATGEGVKELVNRLTKVIEDNPKKIVFEPAKVIKQFNITNLPNRRMVFDEGRVLENLNVR